MAGNHYLRRSDPNLARQQHRAIPNEDMSEDDQEAMPDVLSELGGLAKLGSVFWGPARLPYLPGPSRLIELPGGPALLSCLYNRIFDQGRVESD